MIRFYISATLLCYGLIAAHACTPAQQSALTKADRDLDALCAAKARYALESTAGAAGVPVLAGGDGSAVSSAVGGL